MGEVPANPSALDPNCDFALLETLSFLDALERRSGFSYPQLVLGIRKYTDIGLGEGFGGTLRDGGHPGPVLRAGEICRRGAGDWR